MHNIKIADQQDTHHNYRYLPRSKQKNNKQSKREFAKTKGDMKDSLPLSTEQQLHSSQLQKQMQPNKRIPLPITQTKLTQTHCNLQQIPLIIQLSSKTKENEQFSRSKSNAKGLDKRQKIFKEINKDYIPQKIRELYLSHNQIRSVKNKLRYFQSLKNLNLSYNLLSDVQEFVNEVIGNYEQIQSSLAYNSVGSADINMMNSFQTFGPRLIKQITEDKIGVNLKKDKEPLPLKMLYLRMNKFPYGFQDIIIKKVVSLERYEDYFFKQGPLNKELQTQKNSISKNMTEYQDKTLIFQIGNKVSQYFIPAISKLKEVQQELTIFYESLVDFQDKSEEIDKNNMREQAKAYMNLLEQKYEKIVIKLCQYITKKKTNSRYKKQQQYLPKSRLGTLSQLLEYEGLCLQLQQFHEQSQFEISNRMYLGYDAQNDVPKNTKDKYNKVQRTTQIFTETVSQILIKFENRNNNQLIKTLQAQQIKHSNGQSQRDIINLANTMGKYFKAQHYKIYESNPGKYLQKIDSNGIQNHPYMDYMKYKIQQKQKIIQNNGEVFTLDGNRHRTKNTIIRELHRYADHHKQSLNHNQQDSLDLFDNHGQFDKEEGYYQKMPIVIFERNYLQVIIQIWEDNLRQFVKIYDITYNKLSNMGRNIDQMANNQKDRKIKVEEASINKNNLNINKNMRYLEKQDQYNDKNTRQNMEQFYLDKRKLSLYNNQQSQDQQNRESRKHKDVNVEGNMNQSHRDDYSLTFSFDEEGSNSITKKNSNKIDKKIIGSEYIKIQQFKSGQKEIAKKYIQKQRVDQKQEDKACKEYEERKTIPKFYSISKSIEHDRKESSKQKKIENINDLNAKEVSNYRRSYIRQKINNLEETMTRVKQQPDKNKQKQSPLKKRNKVKLKSNKLGTLKSKGHGQDYEEDLDKYSIYQINLAYKVFLILKKNRNKQKKKRAKKQQSN